jgi:hypothetical protein
MQPAWRLSAGRAAAKNKFAIPEINGYCARAVDSSNVVWVPQ